MEQTRKYKHGTPEERFWRSVRKTPKGCWIWLLVPGQNGYGVIRTESKEGARQIGAHVFSWILHNGSVPEGLFVLHKCDNRLCVNPGHLFLGTQIDNVRDALSKGRLWRKLTIREVKSILRSKGKCSQQSLADKYGVSQCMVSKIQRREWWKWVAF